MGDTRLDAGNCLARPALKERRPWLAVDLQSLARRVTRLAGGAQVVHIAFHQLGRACLAQTSPERVVGPLIAPGFDAQELAVRLVALGFQGRLTVLCPSLPDRALVLRELRGIGRGLTIELAEEL